MEHCNVLLLGFTIPDSVAREIFPLDTSPAIQTHKFAWSLTRALQSSFGRVVLASTCPIQNYPLGRKLLVPGGKFKVGGIDGVLLGFVNLLMLKHVTRFFTGAIRVLSMLIRHEVEWIFVHGIHTPFLLIGLLARLFGKKLAVVLTDPPQVFLPTDGVLTRLLKRIDARLITWAINYADAVVALAPGLISHFSIRKPNLVFPGILDSGFVGQIAKNSPKLKSGNTFTLVYAGGLNRAYGVDRLIDAVESIQGRPIRLKLFGLGDQVPRIIELAAKDPRFEYGGFVDNQTLIPELLAADLLVNPRPSDQAFAALSFPSKLIEYMAVGRPVLTTRIASIPSGYKPYFFFIEDESPEGQSSAILEIMDMTEAEREAHAIRAQKFIHSEASETAVGQKIAELVFSLNLGQSY